MSSDSVQAHAGAEPLAQAGQPLAQAGQPLAQAGQPLAQAGQHLDEAGQPLAQADQQLDQPPASAELPSFLEAERGDGGQRWVDVNLASGEDIWSLFLSPNLNGGYLGKSIVHFLCAQNTDFAAAYPGQVHLFFIVLLIHKESHLNRCSEKPLLILPIKRRRSSLFFKTMRKLFGLPS